MQQALEALENGDVPTPENVGKNLDAITALRERLAQPEQEPVVWMWKDGTVTSDPDRADGTWTPLYTTPPQRKPLTDEEIEDIWADCPVDWDDKINVLTLARAIEAAHGIEENT